MNILFLNFGIGGFAGDASQFLLLVKGLMELGHKVVVVVPDGDEFDKDIALAIRYAVDNGAKVINGSFGKYFSFVPLPRAST